MNEWTAFPELNDVLMRLSGDLQRVLGPELVALYLTGSFALGDADEGSDVDFLAVVNTPLSTEQREAVQGLHRAIFDLPPRWAQHLEGSYFPVDLLRGPDPLHTRVPYLDNGSRTLEDSDHDNALVVRWVTREHGLALFGPPARDLIGAVSPDDLKAEVRNTLQVWGAALLADPAGLDNGWRQPYVALSIARMLHTLDTGAVHSKKAGVAWARDHLAPQWTPLLERAWAQHARQFLLYDAAADPGDLRLTQELIRLAVDLAPLSGADWP